MADGEQMQFFQFNIFSFCIMIILFFIRPDTALQYVKPEAAEKNGYTVL